MHCFVCQKPATRVLESRLTNRAVRRRRRCLDCGQRFTTYEHYELAELVVIKHDGSREPFSRDKLLVGVRQACRKTNVTEEQVTDLVNRVQDELLAGGGGEVTSRKIGQLVVDRLFKVNKVAYMRFTSVYRRFKTVAGFKRELAKIK